MTAALLFISQYRRQLAFVALAALVASVWYYILFLSAERDRLRRENAVLAVQMRDAVAVQDLANRMTEAIGQIRIRSNVNVSRIEKEPAPKFVDARPLPFIAGGVQPFGLYSSRASGGTGPAHAAGGPVPAGEPAGAILPHR